MKAHCPSENKKKKKNDIQKVGDTITFYDKSKHSGVGTIMPTVR